MHKKNCLFFTGIKHSGKTTFASMVANSFSMGFEDADQLILNKTKAESIRKFFIENGKDKFMDTELSLCLEYIESNDNFILSLGGGAADNMPLMNALKENGTIIYLARRESDILPVILKHGIPPFLDKDNPQASFHKIYTQRDAIYREYADLVIELGPYGDKNTTKLKIEKTLKENGYGL